MELFLRKWRAQIGEFSTDQLRIQFKVSKTLEKEPNTCELRITNLAAESRGNGLTPDAPQRALGIR